MGGYATWGPERVNGTRRGARAYVREGERKRRARSGKRSGGQRACAGEDAEERARTRKGRGYRSIVSVAAAANLRLSAADRRETEKEREGGE